MSSKSPVHYSNSYSLPLCPTPRPCHFSYAALSILGGRKRSGSLWQHLAYLRKLSACSHTLTFFHGRNHRLSRSLWAVSCAALGCVCVCNTGKVKLFSLTLFNVSKITFFPNASTDTLQRLQAHNRQEGNSLLLNFLTASTIM